jgi:hypothetical protein
MDNDEINLDYEGIRKARVQREVAQSLNDGPRAASAYRLAVEAITRAAVNYAASVNAPLQGNGPGTTNDILDAAVFLISDLRFASATVVTDEDEKPALWYHRRSPIQDVKAKKTPRFDRLEIESIAGRYLELPYRTETVDRVLVDLLVALELYQYADQMLNEPTFPGFPARSPLKTRPFVNYLVNVVIAALLMIAIGAGLWGLQIIGLFPYDWLFPGYLVLALIFVMMLAISTFALPRAVWLIRKARTKTLELMDQMNGVYAELASNGPISARHIELRARSAADAGVVWPGPLFALLDDINSRTGRF